MIRRLCVPLIGLNRAIVKQGLKIIRLRKNLGIKTLIVTVDVPTQSRREEMRIAGAPLGSRKPMAITSNLSMKNLGVLRKYTFLPTEYFKLLR